VCRAGGTVGAVGKRDVDGFRAWQQPSPYGTVTVVTTALGLHEISLPGDDQPDVVLGPADDHVRTQLDEWFAARRHTFEDIDLDLTGIDGFRRHVLETLVAEVPWGETVTYGELAALAGRPKAPRAAGSAMRNNPIPFVIPCHRVVAAGNKIGGYGGGRNATQLKRALLTREGVTTLR
jgi:methylated-DNA-[protein]-cysteine S-methyltransferase